MRPVANYPDACLGALSAEQRSAAKESDPAASGHRFLTGTERNSNRTKQVPTKPLRGGRLAQAAQIAFYNAMIGDSSF